MTILYRQGIATQTTARLVIRGEANGDISVTVNSVTYSGTIATGTNDGIIAIDILGLIAGNSYPFIITDVGDTEYTGTLKTMPSSGFNLATFSCDTPGSECPAYFTMAEEVDCALSLGDTPYLNTAEDKATWGGITGLDGSTDSVAASADVANYLQHHLRQWYKPSYRKLLETVPFGYIPDDHEHPNNNWALDITGSNEAGVLAFNNARGSPCTSYAELVTAEAAAQEAFVPYTLGNKSDTGELYFTFRPNDDAELFVLDGCTHKNIDTAADTNFSVKFLLGVTQRTWLVNALVASTATFKIIVSPKRPYDSSSHNDDGFINYTKELAEIQSQIASNSVVGVIWLGHDRHNSGLFASAVSDGDTYDHISICGCPVSLAGNHNIETFHQFQKLGVGGGVEGQSYVDAYNQVIVPPGAEYAELKIMNTNGSVIVRERVKAGTNKIQHRSEYERYSI